MLADVPTYYSTPEIRVSCPDSVKFDVVDNVRKYLEPKHRIIDIDGVRVVYEDGWGLVRASNTQPVLVLRFEARTRDRLNEIQEELVGALKAVGGDDISLPEA